MHHNFPQKLYIDNPDSPQGTLLTHIARSEVKFLEVREGDLIGEYVLNKVVRAREENKRWYEDVE